MILNVCQQRLKTKEIEGIKNQLELIFQSVEDAVSFAAINFTKLSILHP